MELLLSPLGFGKSAKHRREIRTCLGMYEVLHTATSILVASTLQPYSLHARSCRLALQALVVLVGE